MAERSSYPRPPRLSSPTAVANATGDAEGDGEDRGREGWQHGLLHAPDEGPELYIAGARQPPKKLLAKCSRIQAGQDETGARPGWYIGVAPVGFRRGASPQAGAAAGAAREHKSSAGMGLR